MHNKSKVWRAISRFIHESSRSSWASSQGSKKEKSEINEIVQAKGSTRNSNVHQFIKDLFYDKESKRYNNSIKE